MRLETRIHTALHWPMTIWSLQCLESSRCSVRPGPKAAGWRGRFSPTLNSAFACEPLRANPTRRLHERLLVPARTLSSPILTMPPACGVPWTAHTGRSVGPASGSTTRPRRNWPRAGPWRGRLRTRGSGTSSGPRWKTRATSSRPAAGIPVLIGKYNVPHFDAKGEANRAFIDRDVPTTLLYYVVLLGQPDPLRHGPRPTPTVVLNLACRWVTGKLPGIAATDIGACALGIFAAVRNCTATTRHRRRATSPGGTSAEQMSLARGTGRRSTSRDASPSTPLGFPRCRRPRQHVPVQDHVRVHVLRRPQPGLRTRAASGPADLCAMAGAPPGAAADSIAAVRPRAARSHGAFGPARPAGRR